tara:strand:+ start:61 stop:594 length:534 start_codon:yes stop_codon:yes gene_type:complete
MKELNQNEINSLVAQVSGEDTVEVVNFILENGENISEFLISEKLTIPMNALRNKLYRLQENNLITFTRKKDKKKGWYIYYWTFNHPQSISMVKKMKESRIDSLRKRLEREDSSIFYTCKSKCIRTKFDHALENNFLCSECGKILKEQDNSKIIKEIKKELTLLEEVSEESSIAEISA